MSYSDRLASSARQADKTARMKARGYVRVSIWVPGDVHRFNVAQAAEMGISLQDNIIRKLRRS